MCVRVFSAQSHTHRPRDCPVPFAPSSTYRTGAKRPSGGLRAYGATLDRPVPTFRGASFGHEGLDIGEWIKHPRPWLEGALGCRLYAA